MPYRLKAIRFEIPVKKRVTKVTNGTLGHETMPAAGQTAPPCSAKPCSCQIYFLNELPPTGLVHDCQMGLTAAPSGLTPLHSGRFSSKGLQSYRFYPRIIGGCPLSRGRKGWTLLREALCTSSAQNPAFDLSSVLLLFLFLSSRPARLLVSRRNLPAFVAKLRKAPILPPRSFAFCFLKVN